MNKVDMLSRCFEVWMYSLHLPPSFRFASLNVSTNLESWVIVMFFPSCPLPKHYVQHIKQLGIMNHVYGVFSFPWKLLRWKYEHNEMSSFLYSLIPSPTASQYVEHVKNIGILSHFWNLSPSTLQSNRFSIWVIVIDLTCFNPFDLTKQYVQQNMWDKLLKFPAHPPYKPIRSTHEQRSETGASKRTKISCGSRRGRQGSSRVVRGRQGSSGVVRGRQGSSGVVTGVVRGRHEGSSWGVVRGRQGSSGVVRSRQGSSGVVRGRQLGVVRGRQGSSGVVRGRQESSGVVRGRQGSSGIEVVRVVRSRQLELDNCCCHLWYIYIYIHIYIYIYIYMYWIYWKKHIYMFTYNIIKTWMN